MLWVSRHHKSVPMLCGRICLRKGISDRAKVQDRQRDVSVLLLGTKIRLKLYNFDFDAAIPSTHVILILNNTLQGDGKCDNIPVAAGSCCASSYECCQTGPFPIRGGFQCCSGGDKCTMITKVFNITPFIPYLLLANVNIDLHWKIPLFRTLNVRSVLQGQ